VFPFRRAALAAVAACATNVARSGSVDLLNETEPVVYPPSIARAMVVVIDDDVGMAADDEEGEDRVRYVVGAATAPVAVDGVILVRRVDREIEVAGADCIDREVVDDDDNVEGDADGRPTAADTDVTSTCDGTGSGSGGNGGSEEFCVELDDDDPLNEIMDAVAGFDGSNGVATAVAAGVVVVACELECGPYPLYPA